MVEQTCDYNTTWSGSTFPKDWMFDKVWPFGIPNPSRIHFSLRSRRACKCRQGKKSTAKKTLFPKLLYYFIKRFEFSTRSGHKHAKRQPSLFSADNILRGNTQLLFYNSVIPRRVASGRAGPRRAAQGRAGQAMRCVGRAATQVKSNVCNNTSGNICWPPLLCKPIVPVWMGYWAGKRSFFFLFFISCAITTS